MSEPTKPSNELSPEENARLLKLFKEQTSPLTREFFYNIGDEKIRKEIIEKVKNLKANLGPDPDQKS